MTSPFQEMILIVQFAVFLLSASTAAGVYTDMTGTNFVIALPSEAAPGSATLHIYSNYTNRLTIEAPFVGLSRTYSLSPGFKDIVLDPALRAIGTQISFKGVQLKSDLPVTVYVVDANNPAMGGMLALPVEALTDEYMIMSYAPSLKSEFTVIAVKDRTSISVHLKTNGNVTFNGRTYFNGDVIHEVLDTFNTWQVQSHEDLTGTVVKADGKIAVIAGSSCAYVPEKSSSCDYVTEQMPAMSTFENRFIIPVLSTARNSFRVLARDDYTEVRLQTGHFPEDIKMNTSDVIERDLNFRISLDPVVIDAERPVLVAHFTGSESSANWGASMTIVPSTVQFKSSYFFTLNSIVAKYTVMITVPTDRKSGLRLNGQSVQATVMKDYIHSGQTVYSVLEVPISAHASDLVFEHLDGIPFGVLLYGSTNGDAFSFPLGYNMDLSISNEKVRLVDGSSPVEGRVEMNYHGNWGTVCGTGFTPEVADVVCRMLGYYYGAANPRVYPTSKFGSGQGQVIVDNLVCDGYEQDLNLCRSGQWEHSTCPHSEDVGISCGTQVRLSGTGDPREGRLEVFYQGQWGTVCDDGFNRNAASVVCRYIGFGNDGYFYTVGGASGPQWLDDLSCSGSEGDPAQCMTKNWGLTDCGHDEDVWVACFSPTRIRLAGGRSPAEGRLEVHANNQWLTVCDSTFDRNAATVVCNMLGYRYQQSSAVALNGAHFGQGSGPVLIDNLRCSGVERDIADCSSREWMISNCNHGNDAGVRCGSSIRLINGDRLTNGRLEVYYDGHWGTVCSHDFDADDARVVCRQLGFPYGVGLNPVRNVFGPGTGNIIIDNLRCLGNEDDIAWCRSSTWLSHNCNHGQDIGVDCGTSVRLVGGSSPTEGRVEVYAYGQWGTVCSDNFDKYDAEVICRQLGYNFHMDRKVYYNAHYGQGTGPIMIDELSCTGNEDDVKLCTSSPWQTTDCSHAQDVGVDCGLRLSDAITSRCTANQWYIEVDKTRLNRVFPNSVPSDIVFGGQSCWRQDTGQTVVFQPHLTECQTVENSVPEGLVYTNILQYAYHDPRNPNIIRNYNWTVTLTCTVLRNGSTDIVITEPGPGHGGSVPSAIANFTVNQAFYSDIGLMHQIPSHPLQLSINRKVYVKIYSPDAGGDVKMVLESCYATPSNNPFDHMRVDLIKDRCRADQSVYIMEQTNHYTTFQFQVFQMDSNHKNLYIHCETNFCPLSDYTARCQQVCQHT